MKVFVSMGFKDRSEEDVMADLTAVESQLKHFFNNDVEMVHNYFCEKPEGGARLYCLGEAIKKLSECDCCCFIRGWEKYNGCHVEMEVCQRYNIPVIFMAGNM